MFDPWVGKILWKRECQPTPVFMDRGAWRVMGYSPLGHKQSDTVEQLTLPFLQNKLFAKL